MNTPYTCFRLQVLAIVICLPTITSAASAREGRVLKQAIDIDAPVQRVWELFSTEEGLKRWMAPLVELDFRIGGTIKSSYQADGVIGDDSTITNTILAYDPGRMLALKATGAPADFAFAEAIKGTWSVFHFEPIDEQRTRLRIHGHGYRDDPESAAMYDFFKRGNEWTLQKLKEIAEAEPDTIDESVQTDASLEQILDEAKGIADRTDSPRLIAKAVIVNTPRSDVWKAWTTPEGITTFFGNSANIELRHRGPFEILFDLEQPEGRRGAEGCEVLSWVDEEMLSFTWNAPMKFLDIRMKRTFVVLQFADAEDHRTHVKLTHGGWGEGEQWDEVYAYFDNAWSYVLDNLVARFNGGEVGQGEVFKPEPYKHYTYFVRPADDTFLTRSEHTAAEREAMAGHVNHIKTLAAENRLILAGPCFDPTYHPDSKDSMIPFVIPAPGIVVFKAHDDEEAKRIMESDPAVIAGVFKAQLNPMNLAFLRP